MRRRSCTIAVVRLRGLHLFLCAAACGSPQPSNVVVPVVTAEPQASAIAPLPVASSAPPQAEQASSFAELVLDAAAAVLSAARGEPHDARFDCSDPSQDLRATPANVRAMVGDAREPFLAGVESLAVVTASGGRYLQVTADLAVWPDGRARWADVRMERSSGSPSRGGTRIDALPPAVRPAAEAIVAELRNGSAAALTPADVAALPLSADDRDDAVRKIARDAETLSKASRIAAGIDGPWSIEARAVVAMVVVGGEALVLTADAKLESDHVCLGPVRGELRHRTP
jgi:hypothetical protein